jgi:signal transduction histidine kinase
MKKISYNIKDYFLSNSLKDDSVLRHKSTVIIYLHFLIITICVCAYISLFFGSTLNSEIPIECGIILVLLSLWFFKKYSNLVLTSNFLAYGYFIILAKSVPTTGGLHSDNLLWLILTPLICLLFANKKSGFLGLAILLCFTFYTFICEKNSNSPLVLQSNDYFLTSFIFLFSSVFGVAIIFEKGQSLIINMLEAQKKELQAQKLALEQKNQEILEQKRQLEKMGQKLKDTNFALEHFAATAAHDLKEPLRMISMYTSLAERRLVQYPDRIRDEYMGFVTNGALRMDKLLTNLLQFSRSGRNEEDVKQVDLNTTLYHVILNLTVVLKDTGASVISAKLPTLHASESEMSQLFQNLIANAIKFRKDNVLSEVSVSYIERKDTHVICIKDNGIGIKQEHQTKVFTIFQRLNDRSKYDGSGIGLATCRRIVDNLNGKIWLRSTEGEGTSFYIAFPKSQTQKYILIQEEELEFA